MPATKKILFRDYPYNDKRGHYTYYDLEAAADYSYSDSIPPDPDKYSQTDLYTTVQEDVINDYIVSERIWYPGVSNIKINELTINNSGISHWIKNIALGAYIWDKSSW